MNALLRFGRLAALTLAAALFVAACVPTSENPITSKTGAGDAKLIGSWTGKMDDGNPVIMHFLKRKDAEIGVLLVTREDKPDGEDSWASFRIVTAELNNTHYLSALWDYDDGKPAEAREKGYHLLRYAIGDDGALRLFSVNEQKLIDAVKTGKVGGKIEGEGTSAEVRLTASSDRLARFLKHCTPEDLFDKPFAKLSRAAL